MLKTQREELRQFLIASENEPELAALRGTLFEKVAHLKLAAGGAFDVRELTGAKGQVGRSSSLDLAPSSVLWFQTEDEVTSSKGSMYCRPIPKNYASVDALMKVSSVYLDLCF